MRPPPEPALGDPDLLQELRDTPDADVTKKAKAAYPFSEEDDDNHRRLKRSEARETVSNITHLFYWFLFLLCCTVAAVFAALLLFVGGYYVTSLIFGFKIADPKTLLDLIGKIFNWALIVMATLFINKVINKRED
jgi:hypothetical protein